MKRKRYPEKNDIRHRGKVVGDAVMSLAVKGIEVMGVDLRCHIPVIEIYHCAGNDALTFQSVGQGVNDGGRYVRKMAHVQGCQVLWNELQD